MLPKLSDTPQTISFSEADGICSAEIYSSNVTITTNAGTHNHGSSKIKLKSLVDYNWECKTYSGQLLATHLSGKYLAYSIKAPNPANPGTWSGMVRVVYSAEPGADRRALIKGMKGEVHDLSFAHIDNEVILACIDEQGNFYVHEIELTDGGLRCTQIAEVRSESAVEEAPHRAVWCPYIPDDEDRDDDVAKLLLTTHGTTARIWNVGALATLGATLGAGLVATTTAHAAPLVDAAFSPDGTALATAAQDGYVMFFQVYMHNEATPRCLHKWQPHEGKPLSCLFFLDNHKNYNSDVQFWKFAVTGADNNSVLKVWSCQSWSCLQTVSLAGGARASLHPGATHLLLADAAARVLYVLQVDVGGGGAAGQAYCSRVTEFLLPYPVLSFCIADAAESTACSSSCDDPFRRESTDDGAGAAGEADEFDLHEEEGVSSPPPVKLRLYVVQPKGLQHAELVLDPPPIDPVLPDISMKEECSEAAGTIASSILQQQSQQLKNLLMRSQTQPGSLATHPPRAESPTLAPLNLMTPDAFSSPGKREEEDPPLSATPDVSKPRTSTSGFPVEEVVSSSDAKFTSVGSSPSREVQEIMALNDEHYYKEHLSDEASNSSPQADTTSAPRPDVPADYVVNNKVAHPPAGEWPQISIAQINEANQRKASSDKSSNQSINKSSNQSLTKSSNQSLNKSSNQSLNNSLNVSSVPIESNDLECERRLAADDRNKIDALNDKLDKLTELVCAQNSEIRCLRAAAVAPREMLEQALQAHTLAMQQGWERVLAAGETAGARAAAAAGAGAARALEPLAAALQHELANKLTATDRLLRDNIDKLASSKSISERLSSAIATSLSDMVRTTLRDTLSAAVLPAAERAHALMFRQLNGAFAAGVKEFVAATETAARAAAERGGAAGAAMLRAELERHAGLLAAHRAATDVTALRPLLEKELSTWVSTARDVLTEQLQHVSRPPSPGKMSDKQMQVTQMESLMQSGDINGAFQLALSASDLSLVVATCRAADPSRTFAPGVLKQHVLLSLIQQLAADMTRDTQLKHRFLVEAIMNLETNNPVTREHLPVVARELQKQIMSFLATNPGHELSKQFKMLLMIADSQLKRHV